MTTTDQPTNIASTCPKCETPGAWHGTGSQGVYACDECGHSEDYGCPDWCVRTDHHVDDRVTANPLHYGPRFGSFITPQTLDGPLHAFVYIDGPESEMTADQLRDLAAHATAAAYWLDATAKLEAHQ